ncbi:hypothetical protein PPYR_13273 [Photinus pyralis]|uniref:BAG domain-containing protein n=1 Tax=Photinus pyralis TaxID=7054 RepID=A0A1Y1MQV9_PHOPY|nr:BAG family molecular chaperone regulator 5-like [Photinus pyralis]KAB0793653.1 hypothetical protein PPYR_13273 [Photinus pyralis]
MDCRNSHELEENVAVENGSLHTSETDTEKYLKGDNVPNDAPEKQASRETEILKSINTITNGIENLRERIEHFSGCSTDDRDYKYLEEMLLTGLVELDQLDTNDNIMLRQERKRAVQFIQKFMKMLDARLTENKSFLNVNVESDDEI